MKHYRNQKNHEAFIYHSYPGRKGMFEGTRTVETEDVAVIPATRRIATRGQNHNVEAVSGPQWL